MTSFLDDTLPSKSEFLSPSKIHGAYSDCIRNAKKTVTLVFPWFNPSPQLKDELFGMLQRHVTLALVTRPPEEAKNKEHVESLHELLSRQRQVTKKKLWGLMGSATGDAIELLFVENVHAKAVVQDDVAVVVTSSNLNVMSIGRNTEFGILCREKQVVQDALQAVENLRQSDRTRSIARGTIRRCDCGIWLLRERDLDGHRCDGDSSNAPTASHVGSRASAAPAADHGKKRSRAPRAKSRTRGSCIRCGEDLRFDTNRPLCSGCYGRWNRYKNPDYEERHCHKCGRDARTSFATPVCRSCDSGQ